MAPAARPVSNVGAVAEQVCHKAREEQLIACYRQHHQQVFRHCLRFAVGRRDLAEDLTQEVFVKLMSCWSSLGDKQDLGGWLYRVSANLAVTRLRRERTWRERVRGMLALEPAPRAETPDAALQTRQAADVAAELLQRLPPKQRVVLVMSVLDDKPQREIASALGLSEGYVSKLLARAHSAVRNAGWEVLDG